jgi:hypothetical protein
MIQVAITAVAFKAITAKPLWATWANEPQLNAEGRRLI